MDQYQFACLGIALTDLVIALILARRENANDGF